MASGVRVEGLRELQRSLRGVDRDYARDMKKELRAIGETVSHAAEQKASGSIRNIGPTWSRMRVGVTQSLVYVAPRARRRGGSPRPNLANLLLRRAMEPAVDEKQDDTERQLESLLDRVASRNGF